MSRRNQQRKRRAVRFDPLKAAGYDNRPHRDSLWVRLLHNKWIVQGGLGIIAVATVFGVVLSLYTGSGNTRRNALSNFQTATPQSSSASPSDSATATATVVATPSATPVVRRYPAAPELTIDANKGYVATIRTEKGDIRVELSPKLAPQAVNTFVFLAKNGYYDGLTFNRVIGNLVAQGGDAGTDTPGYAIPVDPGTPRPDVGTIAFARSDATGRLTAQFYIGLAPLPSREGRDIVFGKVTNGMNVVEALTPRNPERNPTAPPGDKILSIKIDEQPVS